MATGDHATPKNAAADALMIQQFNMRDPSGVQDNKGNILRRRGYKAP